MNALERLDYRRRALLKSIMEDNQLVKECICEIKEYLDKLVFVMQLNCDLDSLERCNIFQHIHTRINNCKKHSKRIHDTKKIINVIYKKLDSFEEARKK